MPLAVIEGGIFGPEVVGYGIARREPPAHLLDAGATFFCRAFFCGAAIFIVFFVK
jgi:hypothetical protein